MDYCLGKIYKIYTARSPHIYIGSTTQPLQHCLYNMRKKPNKDNIRQLLALGGTRIELIQLVACDSKDELNCALAAVRVDYIARGLTVISKLPDATTQLTPIICDCGKTTSKSHIGRHIKSAHHIAYLQTVANIIQYATVLTYRNITQPANLITSVD